MGSEARGFGGVENNGTGEGVVEGEGDTGTGEEGNGGGLLRKE